MNGKLAYPYRYPKGRYYLRRPPPLFGTGLIEAIPDSEIEQLSRAEAKVSAQHAGRVPRLRDGTIGRFGWKAAVATLPAFTSTAFSVEVGVPQSTRSANVALITAYLRDLAAPPQKNEGTDLRGSALFRSIGCADCHRPALRIGYFAAAPHLSGSVIHPYTDLLLHDMGARNAELPDGAASAREFRTAPLWGVAATGPRYMHDGAATSLAHAIRRHGGQASDSATAFNRLSPQDREAVLRFLRSL